MSKDFFGKLTEPDRFALPNNYEDDLAEPLSVPLTVAQVRDAPTTSTDLGELLARQPDDHYLVIEEGTDRVMLVPNSDHNLQVIQDAERARRLTESAGHEVIYHELVKGDRILVQRDRFMKGALPPHWGTYVTSGAPDKGGCAGYLPDGVEPIKIAYVDTEFTHEQREEWAEKNPNRFAAAKVPTDPTLFYCRLEDIVKVQKQFVPEATYLT